MSRYLQLVFPDISANQSELLIAMLSEAGFEGFEEEPTLLKAFIALDLFDETVARTIAAGLEVHFVSTIIEETNWNQVWESNFQPVAVDDFVAVRAGFHEPITTAVHEIVITPKMSFGTGHHATTYMMIAQMRDIDFSNKAVLDFGTGTGILAILAEKLGASQVAAIDYDEWSIENCRENILQNQAARIRLKQADTAQVNEQFDIILANINKNVILDNLAFLSAQLPSGGILLLSGLLATDREEVLERTGSAGFKFLKEIVRHNWLCMKLSRV